MGAPAQGVQWFENGDENESFSWNYCTSNQNIIMRKSKNVQEFTGLRTLKSEFTMSHHQGCLGTLLCGESGVPGTLLFRDFFWYPTFWYPTFALVPRFFGSHFPGPPLLQSWFESGVPKIWSFVFVPEHICEQILTWKFITASPLKKNRLRRSMLTCNVIQLW